MMDDGENSSGPGTNTINFSVNSGLAGLKPTRNDDKGTNPSRLIARGGASQAPVVL
jgi:hypothetical protein